MKKQGWNKHVLWPKGNYRRESREWLADSEWRWSPATAQKIVWKDNQRLSNPRLHRGCPTYPFQQHSFSSSGSFSLHCTCPTQQPRSKWSNYRRISVLSFCQTNMDTCKAWFHACAWTLALLPSLSSSCFQAAMFWTMGTLDCQAKHQLWWPTIGIDNGADHYEFPMQLIPRNNLISTACMSLWPYTSYKSMHS